MNKPLFALGVSLLLLGIGMLYGVSVVAHPGGLDANGCHNNNALGVYECHSGEKAGTTWASREAFEASLVQPVVTPVDGIGFVFEPDWTTLKEVQLLFRDEKVWTVSDGQYLYSLERKTENGSYVFKPVSRAMIRTIDGDQFAQLIQAIQATP